MLRSGNECAPGETAGDRVAEEDDSGAGGTEKIGVTFAHMECYQKGLDLKSSLGVTVMKETYASGKLITIASFTSPLCGKVAQKRRLT